MSLRIHSADPSDAIEKAFSRIQQERMADVPILNLALSVQAVDFQRWHGHWLGIVVTPWCMSLLLVPGSDGDWISAGENKRRFIKFPTGDLAFLGSDEPELGEFQSCSLFSPMDRFSTQSEAAMTARASMVALLAPRPPSEARKLPEEPAPSRRRFLGMGRAASR